MPEHSSTPPEENTLDHLHTLARITLPLVALLGGPTASLAGPFMELFFSSVIGPPITRRRNEWLKEIADRLGKLEEEGRIKLEELGDQPAFVDAVLQATQAAIRTHSRDKREALRNAVLHSALPKPPDASTQLMFLGFVDRFTEWHLRILDLFDDPVRWAAKHKTTIPELMMGGLSHVLLTAFPELKDKGAFYQQVWADLNGAGLLNTSTLGTTMTGSGLRDRRTTDFGQQFLRFISEVKS